MWLFNLNMITAIREWDKGSERDRPRKRDREEEKIPLLWISKTVRN